MEELTLAAGQIISVVGPNGSGKSTLLKTLAGLHPHEGQLVVCGKELSEYRGKQRGRTIAYLPQHLTIPEMDVVTLVSHGRFAHHRFDNTLSDEEKALIRGALEEVELLEDQNRLLAELSGGERQRAYLAMIIAQKTQFLILDEPGSYMDIAHQERIYEILRKLAAEGKGVIVSSHELALSFDKSDRLLIMSGGRIAMDGTPQECTGRQEILYRVFGAGVVRSENADALYRYQLTK